MGNFCSPPSPRSQKFLFLFGEAAFYGTQPEFLEKFSDLLHKVALARFRHLQLSHQDRRDLSFQPQEYFDLVTGHTSDPNIDFLLFLDPTHREIPRTCTTPALFQLPSPLVLTPIHIVRRKALLAECILPYNSTLISPWLSRPPI